MIKIKLGGVEYTLTFNIGFLRLIFKEYNIDPLNTGEVGFLDLAYAIIYCGIVTTYKINNEPLPFDRVKIESMVDELHPNDLNPILSGFTTWMTTPKETVKEGAQEGGTFQAV